MTNLHVHNNREYRLLGDSPVEGFHIGYRADHDFTRGPASIVLIPEGGPIPHPWEAEVEPLRLHDPGDLPDAESSEDIRPAAA